MEYTFSSRRFLLPEELHDPAVSPQQRVAGFHAKGLFDKVGDIDVCHLQAEPTNLLRKTVRDYGLQHELPFYDIKEHLGWLRNLQLRICTTGEVMANLVIGYEDEKHTGALAGLLMQQFPALTTLLVTVNPKWNDSITGLEPRILHGKGYVVEQLEDFRFKIGPKSFFQTNTRQGEGLYRIARDYAELSGKETVYDLYCGTGSIGIFLSRQAARIVGVEAIEEASVRITCPRVSGMATWPNPKIGWPQAKTRSASTRWRSASRRLAYFERRNVSILTVCWPFGTLRAPTK